MVTLKIEKLPGERRGRMLPVDGLIRVKYELALAWFSTGDRIDSAGLAAAIVGDSR